MGIAADPPAVARIEMTVVVVDEAELVVHVFDNTQKLVSDNRNFFKNYRI